MGGIAQLGERLLCKQMVKGSIPFTSTLDINKGVMNMKYPCISSMASKYG